MKKTLFSVLRTMCVGAMTLFAVSCYDDSALWGEVDRLDDRIDSLALELNKDVANLAALQTAVTELETSLEKAIADGDAAVKKALEDQLATVKADLEKAIADGDKAIADALATEKTAIETALKNLQEGLTSVTGSVADLEAALKTFQATVGTEYAALLGKLDELDGVVDGHIANMETALAALKAADEKLNTELVAALAKIAVVKVEEANGNVVLTLADGSKVELSKPLANVDNNGLVTIFEENGVKYWKVVGADTHTGVVVGHPDTKIEFQINGTTNELEYRVNAGEWTSTGVAVEATAENVKLITAFEQTEEYVKLTIGGTEVVLPKYKADTASLVPGRTEFFLRYGGSKKIELEAEGVEDYYVMSKPDGWKASLDSTTLVVYAPEKKTVEVGAAELEGEILIHATTETGKCMVVKIDVSAGPGLTLAVDVKGNVTVENSYYSETTNMWGDVSFGFSDFILGLATPSLFHEDPQAYVQVYNDTWSAPSESDVIFPSAYNFVDKGFYVEGEYETDIVKATVADAYFRMFYEEIPTGASYVVWVAPLDGEGKAVIEDMVYTDYVNIKWDVAIKERTHSDITITADVAGASKFVINAVAESMYNSEWNPMTFDEYMNMPMGGPWNGFKSYGAVEALGKVVPVEEVPAEFKLSEVLGEKLAFGENYKIWVMPVFDHLAIYDEANSEPENDNYVYDYSAFDYEDHFLPFVLDAKTNDIVAGGAYAATLSLNRSEFSAIYVDVELADGTESVFYNWYTIEDYDLFESDAQVMEDLLMNCMFPLYKTGQINKSYINPGDEYVLATFSVGTDGKYGEVVSEVYSALDIPYDEDVKVELVSAELDAEGVNYKVVVNVTGATKVMGYNITHNASNLTNFPTNVCKNGHKDSYYGYQIVNVVDGKAELTFAKSSYKKDYYVAAYSVENNVVSSICATPLNIHLFD